MKSMTGFGRGEALVEGTTWVAECSSVNRKQLEVAVNLPREFSSLETAIRNQVAAVISRGRVNVLIRADEGDGRDALPQPDEKLATHYLASLRALAERLGLPADISIRDIVRLPGVLAGEGSEATPESVLPVIQQALQTALDQLIRMRSVEGAHLQADIQSRLGNIQLLLADIQKVAATVPDYQRQVMRQRLEQAGLPLPLDDERLLKEIALFADRTDISEEISRATSHLKQFRTYLSSGEPAGRSLDFLVQEFFREFNTMGSKANNAEIAHHVVTAKSELEKIREQVQNAE